jgi:hypothetical protein
MWLRAGGVGTSNSGGQGVPVRVGGGGESMPLPSLPHRLQTL